MRTFIQKLKFLFWILLPFVFPVAFGLFCWWAYGLVTGIIVGIIYSVGAFFVAIGSPPGYLEHPSAGEE